MEVLRLLRGVILMTMPDDLITIVLLLVLPLAHLQVTLPVAVRAQAAATLPVAVVALLPDALAAVAAAPVEEDDEVKYYYKK